MKFNLKMLKDMMKQREESPDWSVDPDFKNWLEGFEAELREKLNTYKTDYGSFYLHMSGYKEIKEILGE